MQELKENQGIPRSLLLVLAAVSGLSVANNYYSQPLLSAIAQDLLISELAANHIPMMSQIGYACGLLFIIPLGDLYRRRKIILVDFVLLIAALLVFASA
ncbi:MAG: MFS transporter, partial [Oxalobacter sp.]